MTEFSYISLSCVCARNMCARKTIFIGLYRHIFTITLNYLKINMLHCDEIRDGTVTEYFTVTNLKYCKQNKRILIKIHGYYAKKNSKKKFFMVAAPYWKNRIAIPLPPLS